MPAILLIAFIFLAFGFTKTCLTLIVIYLILAAYVAFA